MWMWMWMWWMMWVWDKKREICLWKRGEKEGHRGNELLCSKIHFDDDDSCQNFFKCRQHLLFLFFSFFFCETFTELNENIFDCRWGRGKDKHRRRNSFRKTSSFIFEFFRINRKVFCFFTEDFRNKKVSKNIADKWALTARVLYMWMHFYCVKCRFGCCYS